MPREGEYERIEERLDPHRREERAEAKAEAVARLRNRGVHVTGVETSEQIAEIMEAVERFEAEVEAHGGDLMVDSGQAHEPDDPIFLLPKRRGSESVAEYLGRIDTATDVVHRRRGAEG